MHAHRVRSLLVLAAALTSGCAARARSPFDPHVMEARLACQSYESSTDMSVPGLPPPVEPTEDPVGFALETTPATPEPGRPSDLRAEAASLVAAEKWREAIPVLQRVMRGEGQDDAGNRQLSEYDLGVAYYRAGLFEPSLKSFEPIAKNRRHLMHHETLYWLVNLTLEEATNLPAIDLAYQYVGENYFELDSSNRELEYLIQYIWGRGYYRAGIYPEAIRKMDAVARDPRLTRIANDCSSLAKQAWRQPIE